MFRKPLFLLFVIAFTGSINPTFSKHALTGVGPFTLLTIRFVCASCLMWVFLDKKDRRLQLWKKIKIPALFGAGNPILFVLSLLFTPATIAPLFYATTPAQTASYGRIFENKKITRVQLFGILIGLLGIGIVTFDTTRRLAIGWGIVLLALAVLSFVLYGVTSEKKQQENNIPSMALAFYFSITTTLLSSIFAFFEMIRGKAILDTFEITHLFAILVMGLTTGVQYMLHQYTIKKLSAVITSLATYLQPVMSISLSLLILGEQLTKSIVIGGAVVLLGASLVQSRSSDLSTSMKSKKLQKT